MAAGVALAALALAPPSAILSLCGHLWGGSWTNGAGQLPYGTVSSATAGVDPTWLESVSKVTSQSMAPAGLKRGIFALSASAMLLLYVTYVYMEVFRMDSKRISSLLEHDVRQNSPVHADHHPIIKVGPVGLGGGLCRDIFQ